jgi:methylated-DNA-[protein]-cysteine S-methyltransferase
MRIRINKEKAMKANQNQTASIILETPIGPLGIEATAQGVHRIDFDPNGRMKANLSSDPAAQKHLDRAVRQLSEYFAGRRDRFELTLDMNGTAHQQRVWKALLEIPFGGTLTYGQVAARLGKPGGARAVGRACATNPVPVVVPCHRVLGGDGALHGFGGGLWRKKALLALEQKQQQL